MAGSKKQIKKRFLRLVCITAGRNMVGNLGL
jgi:hypothetical protein